MFKGDKNILLEITEGQFPKWQLPHTFKAVKVIAQAASFM
jgi:hypothetical protein